VSPQHLLDQCFDLVLNSAAGVLPEVLIKQLRQKTGVGVEGRVNLCLEAIRDLLRALAELLFNLVRLAFELGLDEISVGGSLFTLQNPGADLDRLADERIQTFASGLTFACERDRGLVIDGEPVDEQLVAEQSYLLGRDWSDWFH